MRGPRAGRPGCGWLPCHWPGTRTQWFAAEFSGSERTVAEYLLAEVLERQSEEVRRLLLRTSVLERSAGKCSRPCLPGGCGERILQDLEEAGAFVVSLGMADAGPGSATTACSPTCSSWSCGILSRANCLRCTPARGQVVRPERIPRRGSAVMQAGAGQTGAWPHAYRRITGSTLILAGRPPPRGGSSSHSRPTSPRPTRSSPR